MKSTDDDAIHKKAIRKAASPLVETFGISPGLATMVVALIGLALAFTIFWSIKSAPPKTIIISAGPPGSVFEVYAKRYYTNLKNDVGIKLKILPSQGSIENIERLNDPKFKVDVGFVQGGITNGADGGQLISLGSVYNMPLLVFYKSTNNIELLSELRGKRLAIGPKGSGTRMLALALLQVSGIDTNGPTQLLDWDADSATQALLTNRIDAVFMTGDSASPVLMRKLLHTPNVQLMDFAQAEAYSRKLSYVTRMDLPEGGFDFSNDIPSHDIRLVGTTVELIARAKLHPALSDQLLDAATQVHGNAGLFRHRGEFPSLQQHDYKISEEAVRYQKNGKMYLYKHLPFWLAAAVNFVLVAFVPVLFVAIPALRVIPSIYKWRVRMVIYRWYRALLRLERQTLTPITPERRRQLLAELGHIEHAVNKMKVPASFANDYYSLRGHIDYVHTRLMEVEDAAVDDPMTRQA